MHKLQVNSGKSEYEFEIRRENGQLFLRENGSEKVVDLRRLGVNRYSLIIDGRSIEVGVNSHNGGYRIYKGCRASYFVVEDSEIARLKKKAGISDDKANKTVTAPMPGLIVSIERKPGDDVGKGESLLVMEAMKMENDIKAQSCGKVKAILVEIGQSVDKGQKLVEFE